MTIEEINCDALAAYVVGERQGLILERPFKYGETLRDDGRQLDVDAELKFARDYQRQLAADDAEQKNERKAMKELGLARYNIILQ
jgi:fatty acyl-CoA reductase